MAPTHVEVGQRLALADLEPAAEPFGRDGKPAIAEDDGWIDGALVVVKQADQVQMLIRDLPDALVAAVQPCRPACSDVPEVDLALVQVALQRQALKPLGAAVEQQHLFRLRSHPVLLSGCRRVPLRPDLAPTTVAYWP